LKYQETYFIDQWIGQIYLVLGYPDRGIYFLERARKLSTPDVQLLYNLARAYYNTSRFNEGDGVLAELRRTAPGSSYVDMLVTYKNSLRQ
jgi:hypothetical protein